MLEQHPNASAFTLQLVGGRALPTIAAARPRDGGLRLFSPEIRLPGEVRMARQDFDALGPALS
jgi:hypothetical protein